MANDPLRILVVDRHHDGHPLGDRPDGRRPQRRQHERPDRGSRTAKRTDERVPKADHVPRQHGGEAAEKDDVASVRPSAPSTRAIASMAAAMVASVAGEQDTPPP